MPHRLPTGFALDSGDYAATMDAALTLAGYADLRRRQRQLRAQGRYLGIGLATFSASSSVGPSMAMPAIGFQSAGHESARVVVHADGRATVFCGTQSTGQGHATSFAQIAAEVLGIPRDDIAVVEGDTQTVPLGTGTFNSRSMSMGGVAVYEAAREVMRKARTIAAYGLQVRTRDLRYEDGIFRPKAHLSPLGVFARSTRRVAQRIVPLVFKRRTGIELPAARRNGDAMTFADVARAANLGQDLPLRMAPGLDVTHFFDPRDIVYDYGAHVAVVEVDAETGHVGLVQHVMVDDCGRVINPLLVDGQAHGGAAQGIGQALMEAVPYGRGGVTLVRGFNEYAMPRAADLPSFDTGRTETPTTVNPLGVRGVGEGATIGATPAVVNAVLDALEPLGVTDVPMPMTPRQVWQAIQRAQDGRRARSGRPAGAPEQPTVPAPVHPGSSRER